MRIFTRLVRHKTVQIVAGQTGNCSKNKFKKAVDHGVSMTYLVRRFNAESHVPKTLKIIFLIFEN